MCTYIVLRNLTVQSVIFHIECILPLPVMENDHSNKQDSTRSKLSRFYPFVNEWLKRKRIPSSPSSPVTLVDTSDGPSIFDVRSNMATTPVYRAEVVTPVGADNAVTNPLTSCLQRSSVRKSKTVKLSHTDYVKLAAVPCVPEGVDVPPDLVPRRNLSAPQSRTRVYRSQTMSPDRQITSEIKAIHSVVDGCSPVVSSSGPNILFQRSTSFHNKIVGSPFRKLTPYTLTTITRT